MELKTFIERIIDEIGPRPAGSEAEFRAGERIAEEWKGRGAGVTFQDVPVCPDLISRAVNINMETLGAGSRAGIDLPAVRISYGGTDSRAIVKAGGRSACLFGMDETGLFSLWHSPEDNPDNISEENLQQALRVCIEAIREYEGGN